MDTNLIKGLTHYTAISSRVLISTLSTIAVFTVPAYFLDEYLGTDPWLFLIAFLVSLPFSLYVVHRVMTSYLSTFTFNK